jgi:hypothetical protein
MSTKAAWAEEKKEEAVDAAKNLKKSVKDGSFSKSIKDGSMKDSMIAKKDTFLADLKDAGLTPEELKAQGEKLLEAATEAAKDMKERAEVIMENAAAAVAEDPVGMAKNMLAPIDENKVKALSLMSSALSTIAVANMMMPGSDGKMDIPEPLLGQFQVDPIRMGKVLYGVQQSSSAAVTKVLDTQPLGSLDLTLPKNIITQVPPITPKLKKIQNSGLIPTDKLCCVNSMCCCLCGLTSCNMGGHYEGNACKCMSLKNTWLCCDFGGNTNPWCVCNCADFYMKYCVSAQLCACCGFCPAPCICESRSGYNTCFQQETCCARAGLCKCCCGCCVTFNEFSCCKIPESCCYLFGTFCCFHYRQICIPGTNDNVPCTVSFMGIYCLGSPKKDKKDGKKGK